MCDIVVRAQAMHDHRNAIKAKNIADCLAEKPKRRIIDCNGCRSDLFYYCITLCCKGDWTDAQELAVIEWHRRGDFCCLVWEFHRDGSKHYHSLLAVKTPKSTNAVVRALERFYEKQMLEVVKGISIVVKRMTEMQGWMGYLMKDKHTPLLTYGWSLNWIKEYAKSNLKKMPLKMLKGETYMVQKNTSVELVLKYSDLEDIPITGKYSFIECCISMQASGYQFDNIKKSSLYTNVMARVNCLAESRSVWEMELMCFQ